MKKYYLAYGSNLNVQQMRYRCPDATIFGTAEIPDYQLLFKGSMTGFYLTIEKKEGSTVPVAVWEVSECDERNLDAYEGCPNFYYKTEMEQMAKMVQTERMERTASMVLMENQLTSSLWNMALQALKMTGYKV